VEYERESWSSIARKYLWWWASLIALFVPIAWFVGARRSSHIVIWFVLGLIAFLVVARILIGLLPHREGKDEDGRD
jgi:hypothetical protein